ncbi:hypothetical protein YK48G_08820 [Lentilactobacillus fungorum]|uniref:Glycosyl hydrolase n=1 Tax=Lentilactobacillus fungorum TaxID=2201250 RepID=A0ABQ3VZ10_9LACO|nr:beta-L-arabinofuranosidase domain-containing protein [Lentilactobacillus fungorum]GHP13457.1 hypothetical protein YK48G_08820 [Lentilactobacillus fungorum]
MKNMTENKRLLEDIQHIYLGNLGTVDADLDLPTVGHNGSQFQWQSDEHLFMTDDGKVTRPTPGVGNRVVHLNLTASLNEEIVHQQYTVTVVQQVRQVAIDHPIDLKLTVHDAHYQLPQVVVVALRDGSFATAEVAWAHPFEPSDSGRPISGVVKENGDNVSAIIKLIPQADHQQQNSFQELPVSLTGDNPYISGYHAMLAHLKTVDPNRLLYNFRQAAGLPVDDSLRMTGWDAPDCKLRGHTTGHYMSALALAYFDSQKAIYKDKVATVVAGLAEVQAAFTKKGAHPGFLSAYDETQFDQLEHFETYPNIWAPYYTLDKILSGLLDSYHYAQNEQALKVAQQLGDWVSQRLGKLSHDQLTKMWSIYIAGEFGGMISAMVRLYRETGKVKYLTTAKRFTNDKLFIPMLTHYDTLNNLHANQHIPQIIGAVDLYQETGDDNYLKIAQNFWQIVVQHHTFANGGVGENEMFHEADTVAAYLTDHTDETCASYNMFKLSNQLFQITRNKKYMAYAENVLNNHLLVANDHQIDGGSTYFLPLKPGGEKHYDTDADNTCCHGTGLENMVRFQKDLYGFDGANLYVNLFYDSRLKLPKNQGEIFQQVTANQVTLKMHLNRPLTLLIRVPNWMTHLRVKQNGQVITVVPQNGYLRVAKLLGDQAFQLDYETSTHLKAAPDDQSLMAVFRGPDMLVRQLGKAHCIETSSSELKRATQLVPFNTVHDGRYQSYFKVK